jgi:hypothetical protein
MEIQTARLPDVLVSNLILFKSCFYQCTIGLDQSHCDHHCVRVREFRPVGLKFLPFLSEPTSRKLSWL